MSPTRPLKNESTISELNMPLLNVPTMIKPILHNFDQHVNNFIRFLRDKLQLHLIYEGPIDIQQHILQKTMYACSVFYKPKKYLKNVFPVMIGSRLDIAIRHEKLRTFKEPFDLSIEPLYPFCELDIGQGFFLIGGFLRHLPYFYTSDPTNTHIIQRKIVRVYSYDYEDRGKELSLYMVDLKDKKCGDIVVSNNDGKETGENPYFFNHCPYPVNQRAYMYLLYREGKFDIDHLGNKVVISPGHLFTKLFSKYLYIPLLKQNWTLAKVREALVTSTINTGNVLHVLSRKTVYFKEATSVGKMTNEPQESHREIGANGEVFMEKSIGSWREVPTQTYPLNPYLQYVIVRQMSKKVKSSSVESFHPSYLNFLCILGVFETKNVGRTTMMVRDTIVSTCNDLEPIYGINKSFWNTLNLEYSEGSHYHVVVNEACIPVTRKCFYEIDLFRLKMIFQTIECYEREKFIIIRRKMGLIMNKLCDDIPIYVTPYDKEYWMQRYGGNLSTTSYLVDLNPFFNHTAFPKNILAFNAMKNAILATDPKYALYFMDTLSAYFKAPTSDHKVLLKPKDDRVSKHFVLKIPQPVVAYMSFKGCTQEDCIVKRSDFRSFDSYRFYTLRIKFTCDDDTWVKFYPVKGDVDPECDLLGSLTSGEPMQLEPFSIHVRLDKISPCEYRIYFLKSPFRVLQHFITGNILIVSVEQQHVSNTGDKLCSLHGQKGVIRVMDKVPALGPDEIRPDLIINPYCMFRMTPGQILESVYLGEGKDATLVKNSEGVVIENAVVFYGKTFYLAIAYLACEHLYAPKEWRFDRVTNQPVKGRSRGGGMRLGNMESNALRGNGIAFCFEEKFFEDGDRVPVENQGHCAPLPKSVNLVVEDAKFIKCNLEYKVFPSVAMEL